MSVLQTTSARIPHRLFTWSVLPADEAGRVGPVGVTSDRSRALSAVGEELRRSPHGALGVVATVRLNEWTPLDYDYEQDVIYAVLDPCTSTVVLSP